MQSKVIAANPGSFRDPSGHVYDIDGRIFRTVTAHAVRDFEAVRESGVYRDMVADGMVIAGEVVRQDIPEPLKREASVVLEHPRLPFVSYPYEWSFSALRAAALLHLDIHLRALESGITLSDSSAYNVQFIGAKPIFIDTLSFRPYQQGEYWTGHRQFCEQFLNPLLLYAKLGVRFNDWYRGSLEGIPTADISKLLPLHQKLSWDVLTNLVLPSAFDRSARRGGVRVDSSDLGSIEFPLTSYRRLLVRLRAWIDRLRLDGNSPTTWQNYSSENSYGSEEADAKRRFVRNFIHAEKPKMVWDLGCNTGDYSEVALEGGAGHVIGWDFDQGALETAFVRADRGNLAMTPLYFDATNPSPNQGWAEAERQGLHGRGPADAVLALAFVHHLALAGNVPLAKIVDWLAALAPSGVVEFVPKEDSMVREMLRIRADIFPDYCLDRFIDLLAAQAHIVQVEPVNGRQLIWYRSPNS